MASTNAPTSRKQKKKDAKKKATNKDRKGGDNDFDDNVDQEDDQQAESEVEVLEARIAQECPPRGYAPLVEETRAFRTLPLSQATMKGLERHGFTIMTPIQNACLGHALAGRDVLGAAKTGSGKTLAFLIPVLETLYRQGYAANRTCWNDGGSGPGAIILSPTRELAAQTFEVLRKVGSYHELSAGLVVGGTHSSSSSRRRGAKNPAKSEWAMEQARIVSTNILVATPGRLLQHLEQTVQFADALSSFLQVLVLDEADRILDMGFRSQLLSILEYLPQGSDHDRQTMLFSATQTKRVADLALLALHQPEYIGISDKAWKRKEEEEEAKEGDTLHDPTLAMPSSLVQRMVVVPLGNKLDVLFSFVRSHLQCRMICFFATCAQVRFAYELFCALRPGVSVLALHGKLRQERRQHVYQEFWRKGGAVVKEKKKQKQKKDASAPPPHGTLLFATDVAARGLDFPAVDWVLQVDAPEDLPMYIHRAGRTARYQSGGQSLLMVRPGAEEEVFTQWLAPLAVQKVRLNPQQTVQTSRRAASLVASDVTLQKMAKRAFSSYIRCLSLMPRRDVLFSPKEEDWDGFATSLGLAFTPPLPALPSNRQDLRHQKNVNRQLHKLKLEIQRERMEKRNSKNGKSKGTLKRKAEEEEEEEDDDDDDDDDLLVVKKRYEVPMPKMDAAAAPPSTDDPPKSKKIRLFAGSGVLNKRIVFDEDGQVDEFHSSKGDWKSLVPSIYDAHVDVGDSTVYQNQVQRRLQATTKQDIEEQRRRVQEMHKKKKRKAKEAAAALEHGRNDEGGAILSVGMDMQDDGEDHDEEENTKDRGHVGYDQDNDDMDDVNEADIREKEERALAMLL